MNVPFCIKVQDSKKNLSVFYKNNIKNIQEKNENIMLAVIHLAHTQDFPKNQHFFTPHPHPVYLIVF